MCSYYLLFTNFNSFYSNLHGVLYSITNKSTMYQLEYKYLIQPTAPTDNHS